MVITRRIPVTIEVIIPIGMSIGGYHSGSRYTPAFTADLQKREFTA